MFTLAALAKANGVSYPPYRPSISGVSGTTPVSFYYNQTVGPDYTEFNVTGQYVHDEITSNIVDGRSIELVESIKYEIDWDGINITSFEVLNNVTALGATPFMTYFNIFTFPSIPVILDARSTLTWVSAKLDYVVGYRFVTGQTQFVDVTGNWTLTNQPVMHRAYSLSL